MNQRSRISVTRFFLVCILLISLACLPATAADVAADSLAISNNSEEAAENVTVSEPTATETAGTVLAYWDWGFGDYDKTYIINVAYTSPGTKEFIAEDWEEEVASGLPSLSKDEFKVIVKGG